MKVVIDCDPGVDDMMAILFALGSPELEVVALTITHGNLGGQQGLEQLGRNALHILRVAGRKDVPVHLGAAEPLVRPAHNGAPFVHGGNGVGDMAVDGELLAHVASRDAASFLVRVSREVPGLRVIALGPLTNLAMALKLDSGFSSRVTQVSLMGGAFGGTGNITPLAEANIYNDPEAAHLVFNAPWPILVAPLNVTRQTCFDASYLENLGASPCCTMVREAAQFYLGFFRDVVGRDLAYVHDSTAVAALLMLDNFVTVEAHVDVECSSSLTLGVTVSDLRVSEENRVPQTKNCTLLLQCKDPSALLDAMKKAMQSL